MSQDRKPSLLDVGKRAMSIGKQEVENNELEVFIF